jgi:filamentous hemagglutinin family protein
MIVCLCVSNIKQLYAEIITDGTVGPINSLPGPDFIISEKLGQKFGNNLFHSFKDFNINTGESATFTGPDSVTNILTRVTGGNYSFIDGPLRSKIPNASLYLINPNGILFGKNASLDITGSFHASTADVLYLEEGGRFSVGEPNKSVLTVALPSAFGFLDSSPAPIWINGSFIETGEGNTLSIIGGELQIEDATLYAPGGRINIAAVASEGEVVFSSSDLLMESFDKLGKITLSHSFEEGTRQSININGILTQLANIDVSSIEGGQIFIRAGQLTSNHGWLFADNFGGKKAPQIDMFIDGDMFLSDITKITSDNLGKSQGGYLNITTTNALLVDEQSIISTNNFNTGTGGKIQINTPHFGMRIGLIQSATEGRGNAGNIEINAQQIALQNLGFINTGTKSSGQAGNIRITTDKISLSNWSSISSSTASESSGNAGHIQLNAQYLTLEYTGQINAFSLGSGNAGSIKITTDNASLINGGILASLATQGNGSDINLSVRHKLLIDNSFIMTRTTQNDAGDITIDTESFIFDHSDLEANAVAGEGGKIDIRAGKLNILGESVIDVSSKYGINGSLILNSIKLTDDFMVLPPPTFQGAELFEPNCKALPIEGLSQFIVKNMNPWRINPEDLQTYHDR